MRKFLFQSGRCPFRITRRRIQRLCLSWLAGLLLCTSAISSRADSVILFNEIMYNPAGGLQDLEWVEIFNTLSYDMDISEWRLKGAIDYTFPTNTTIRGEGFIVIAKSPAMLAAAAGITNAYGPFNGQLSNGGDTIRLENNSGRVMDEIDYSGRGKWPVAPDGSGTSLAKIAPFTASPPAGNWHCSRVTGGTPGAKNFPSGSAFNRIETKPVPTNAVWKYRDTGGNPGATWMLPSYNDNTWSNGPAQLGYGDGDEATVVRYGPSTSRYPATHFRYRFTVNNPTNVTGIRFNIVVDDGAVIYLNGTEVSRLRMPTGTVTYLTYATSAAPEPGIYEQSYLPVGLLQTSNVLAVEVHQYATNDSDMSWAAELAVVTETNNLPASPSGLLAAPLLTINEIADATNASWWIELANASGGTLNPGGYVVSVAGDPGREYTVTNTSLPAGGFLVLTAAKLGFTAQDEEPVFLYKPGKTQVMDSAVAKRTLHGLYGKEWLRPSAPTPGAANTFTFNNDIVINEIMYHHQPFHNGTNSTESDVEWIELYNRGTGTVNMTGWKLDDGINYSFPSGTMLGSGSYLVVSNFSGNLPNGGARIALVDATGNPADEVSYADGGRWPDFTDGGGSSLELRNPFADNSVPEAWAASDESSRSSWQTYVYRTTAYPSSVGPDFQWKEFVLGLLDAGEVLLDDISVIEDPDHAAIEFIPSGNFSSGIGGWRILGNHRHSEVIDDPNNPGNPVLRLVASGPTEHMHNHAEITLAGNEAVNNALQYRISFRAKWISGSRLLNTRLYFNRTPKTFVLNVPMTNGTPGAPNSVFEANIGPVFDQMRHEPVVPMAGQAVTVSIHAADPQGVKSARVWYSVSGGAWTSVVMAAGTGGLYTATLPGKAAASIVQFYVQAEDMAGAVSAFPAAGPDSRALYKVNDGQRSAILHNFRIIMTAADTDFMNTDIQLMSNEQLGCTVIFDDRDVYYDAGVRYKSSERGRVSDTRIGFQVSFNADQPFHGVHQTVAVDRSAGMVVGQREMLINQAMNRGGGVLSKYSDLIRVIAPRAEHTSSAELQLARYDNVFLNAQFENGGDGTVYEYESIYYPTTADTNGYKLPSPDSTVSTPIKNLFGNKENYRWTFLIKNNRARDDYSRLIEFANVFGLTGTSFNAQAGAVVDADQWLRYMAYSVANGHGDSYSAGTANHNAMFYVRPSDGRVLYFPHDMDFQYVTNLALVPNTDLSKLISTPEREHLYYGHMWDILQTVYNTTYLKTWTDRFVALLPTENFASYLSFIGTRHDFLINELNARVAPAYPFEVTTGDGTVDALSATVTGVAWLNVNNIYLEGLEAPLVLTWTASGTGTSRIYFWSATVPLQPGVNPLTFRAYDFQGRLVGSDTVTITSTATGQPLKDHLRITELMAAPPGGSDYEFIELCNTGGTTLDLAGVYFAEGVNFDFSAAGFTALAPGAYCVVVRDRAAFSNRYGTAGITIAGQYTGKLANEGETISIQRAAGEEILRFNYQSDRGWPLAAAGSGHALVPLSTAIARQNAGSLYYGGNWRAGTWIGGSPGVPENAPSPSLLLNEIIAHTDYSDPAHPEYDSNDKIELYNVTDAVITPGSGWFLSDDPLILNKWAIPTNTVIPAHGWVCFDEATGFHSPITSGFGLDKAGEQLLLSYLPASGAQRVVDTVRFKGQENDVTLGRYGDGETFWYAESPSPGTANIKPFLHPVISEIMYRPPDNPTNNTLDEYIEILNPATAPVNLWNEAGTWRVAGGIDFQFPTNTTLAPGACLLLVTFNPTNSGLKAGFLAKYGLADGEVALLGPVSGQLDNRGERIALERPQAGDLPGDPVSWVLADEVIYFHQQPWPEGADGTGRSLQRKHTRWSGSDPVNWYASFAPSPGTVREFYGTAGVPDWWLAGRNPVWTNNFEVLVQYDPDFDSLITGKEYITGTDPLDPDSLLSLQLEQAGSSLRVRFRTLDAGSEYNGLERCYTLKSSTNLIAAAFADVPSFTNLPGDGADRIYTIPSNGDSGAFYRLEVNLR